MNKPEDLETKDICGDRLHVEVGQDTVLLEIDDGNYAIASLDRALIEELISKLSEARDYISHHEGTDVDA